MPIFESRCHSCGHEAEHYYRTQYAKPQPCDECQAPTHFLISRFNAPWTGTLDRFDEPGKQTHMGIEGGHIAYKVRSTQHTDGSPQAVRITTRSEQKQYCREEGLEDPAYDNPNNAPTADGSWDKSRPKGAWL